MARKHSKRTKEMRGRGSTGKWWLLGASLLAIGYFAWKSLETAYQGGQQITP